ncbi:uncharacterized protein AMSG_00316 [Thecamonas trahens ATCC 50062]|uniref:Uncharacterized protein n=1 Tax=Thecamonas trahens ATCC 50062 TaxID=461836 RepID=A0A0L0D1R2_THETB|nr:hypothetical protein AMSG_00316 [Thecamonas trahens ATCC 50062]KNC46197.1 hypothetical protein AMSG_00316 [Thecamonas trahens ATCC 50062]|eukprot:XP_013763172.1 hypothetical protein AMSG_00316 [Thecamonas trahens ATCC 50062]
MAAAPEDADWVAPPTSPATEPTSHRDSATHHVAHLATALISIIANSPHKAFQSQALELIDAMRGESQPADLPRTTVLITRLTAAAEAEAASAAARRARREARASAKREASCTASTRKRKRAAHN